jgi:hypothetical protein
MRFISMLVVLMICLAHAVMAIAQTEIGGFPVPEADITALLLKIATDYKSLGLIGGLSVAILLTVQAIKAWVDNEWKYKRLLTLAVSIIYSILAGLIVPGSNAATVIVSVFISSGGAVALYEALKGAGIIKST